jgi:hypothetical protein
MRTLPYEGKVGDWFLPELLVFIYRKVKCSNVKIVDFVANGESRPRAFLTARRRQCLL